MGGGETKSLGIKLLGGGWVGEKSSYDEYALSRVDEVYRLLQSGPDGLTGDKAADGFNNMDPTNYLPPRRGA